MPGPKPGPAQFCRSFHHPREGWRREGRRCWSGVREKGELSLKGGRIWLLGENAGVQLVKGRKAEAGAPPESVVEPALGCEAGAEGIRDPSQDARPLGPLEGPELGGVESVALPPPTLPQGGPRGLGLTASPLFPSSPPASDILNYYFLCNREVSNPFQQVRAAGKGTGWGAGLGPRRRGPGGG